MNGEDVFVYHLSVVISQCRKPDQEERVFLGSQFQSLQLGPLFLAVCSGEYHSRKTGKTAAREERGEGWETERARSQG